MHKGITPVVATILLLLITISMIGFSFVFMQRTAQTSAQAGESQLNQTTGQITTLFSIEGVDKNKVYLRNRGAKDLNANSLNFYVNNVLVESDITIIAPGIVGAVALNDSKLAMLPDPAELKVTSAGFSDKIIADFYGRYTIAYWKLDEGSDIIAQDSSGYGNTGSLLPPGSGPLWITGLYGNALSFSGSNYIEVSHSAYLDLSQLTIQMWIKTPSSIGCACYRAVLSKQGADRDYNFYTYSNNGNTVTHLHFSSARFGSSSFTLPQPFQANTWHLIEITVDSTGLQKYYYDGNLFGSFQGTAGNANSNYPVWIARADNYWNGVIDEVKVLNVARSMATA